ncbi:hypothetical protein MRX96_022944 [Rhipicephalus microplus]
MLTAAAGIATNNNRNKEKEIALRNERKRAQSGRWQSGGALVRPLAAVCPWRRCGPAAQTVGGAGPGAFEVAASRGRPRDKRPLAPTCGPRR